MTGYRAPIEDIVFLLQNVFRFDELSEQLSLNEPVDMTTGKAVLGEVGKLCEEVIAPLNAVGDQQGCRWDNHSVRAPDGFVDAYRAFCDGGWGGLSGNPNFGGMGLPKTLVAATEECLQGANMAFGLAPMLTAGACIAIDTHASDTLKNRYLPKLYSGEWAATMALTEAHAGSDLGLIKTKAEPLDDDRYRITGSKIFITWGEHDLTENIVHLVLAKLPGGGEGAKGISLFLVPKFLPNGDANDEMGERNALSCGSIEEKMGIHGSATCVMNFDGATGWLIGEPHRGLACMFTMMNYERLVVGIQALGVAEAAYQKAKAYALDRRQGKAAANTSEPDAIIHHQDVRRTLLQIKSINEAGRAFYLYVATWLDRAKYGRDEKEKSFASDRVALLTPVVKAFLSDRALDACVDAQQVLGGHGYVREWGLEQYVRDVRITQIYEGTNGIQALDLGMRKTAMCDAKLIRPYFAEMRDAALALSSNSRNLTLVASFEKAVLALEDITERIATSESSEWVKSACTDYLAMVGYVSFAYMWVLQISALDDATPQADSKRLTAEYFFAKVLSIVYHLEARIGTGDAPASAFAVEQF